MSRLTRCLPGLVPAEVDVTEQVELKDAVAALHITIAWPRVLNSKVKVVRLRSPRKALQKMSRYPLMSMCYKIKGVVKPRGRVRQW